jgi:hypothetical protein
MAWRWFNYTLIYFVFSMAFFTVVVARKPNQAADQHAQNTQKEPQASATSKNDKSPEAHAKEADSNTPKWYASLERPEWWLVIVGFLTLIFVAWQAYETKLAVQGAADSVGAMQEQRDIMQGQLDIMKGQLELEHRPWVTVDIKPNSPIIFDQRGCVLMCEVTLTNVGHSVAKHVSLWTDFALLGIENPKEVRDKLCDIMRHPQNKGSDYGWLLFPGQRAIEQRPLIAVPERIKKALENKTFQGLNAIGLHLVGCADYPSSINPEKRHQTRFEYTVSFVDPTNGLLRGAFDPSQKTYLRVVLMPTMHGASAD